VTFWLNVGLCYLALLAVGLGLGIVLGSRRRGGGNGEPEPVAPEPVGPSLAADCRPLGSSFDRALLPGVSFADEHVPA
jgi:hypothetical protein